MSSDRNCVNGRETEIKRGTDNNCKAKLRSGLRNNFGRDDGIQEPCGQLPPNMVWPSTNFFDLSLSPPQRPV